MDKELVNTPDTCEHKWVVWAERPHVSIVDCELCGEVDIVRIPKETNNVSAT